MDKTARTIQTNFTPSNQGTEQCQLPKAVQRKFRCDLATRDVNYRLGVKLKYMSLCLGNTL